MPFRSTQKNNPLSPMFFDQMPDQRGSAVFILNRDNGNIQRIWRRLVQKHHRKIHIVEPMQIAVIEAICEDQ
jgi:hypothetical protein